MLGPRIAVLRRNAGMSQAELARHLRISPSTMGMYEQGRREPSLETLAAMAELFGVSIDFLVTGQMASPQEQALVNQILLERTADTDRQLQRRPIRPFSRQELAVLFAAMLMDP